MTSTPRTPPAYLKLDEAEFFLAHVRDAPQLPNIRPDAPLAQGQAEELDRRRGLLETADLWRGPAMMQLALAVVLLIASFGTTSAECAEVLWNETEHSGPGSLATPKGSEVLGDHRRRLGAESVPGSVAGDVAGRIKDTERSWRDVVVGAVKDSVNEAQASPLPWVRRQRYPAPVRRYAPPPPSWTARR
jgi:hypothetical protein